MNVERSDDETQRQEATTTEPSLPPAIFLMLGLFLSCVLVWLVMWTLSEVQALQGKIDHLRWTIEHRERAQQP